MIKFGYFGEKWDAPVCELEEQVPTPVGHLCLYCKEPILAEEQGFVRRHLEVDGEFSRFAAMSVHRECDLRSILGGIAHMEMRCTCCGGTVDPDDGLSWRESSRRVMAFVERFGARPIQVSRFKAAAEILMGTPLESKKTEP